MNTNHSLRRLLVIPAMLLIGHTITLPAFSQQADTSTNASSNLKAEKSQPMSPIKKIISDVVKKIVGLEQFVQLSFEDRTIRHRIEKDAPVYKLPGGESRTAVFQLPNYVDGYTLTIKSLIHGIGFKWHIFSPTGIFLDSSFRPTHLLREKQFLLVSPDAFSGLHLKAELVMDSTRKDDKYLLLYTLDTSERLATFSDQGLVTGFLKHPVERSPDGKLQLELHLK